MKISELIIELNKCAKENGDIEIRFLADCEKSFEDNDTVEIKGICTHLNETDKPVYAILCDEEGILSFL